MPSGTLNFTIDKQDAQQVLARIGQKELRSSDDRIPRPIRLLTYGQPTSVIQNEVTVFSSPDPANRSLSDVEDDRSGIRSTLLDLAVKSLRRNINGRVHTPDSSTARASSRSSKLDRKPITAEGDRSHDDMAHALAQTVVSLSEREWRRLARYGELSLGERGDYPLPPRINATFRSLTPRLNPADIQFVGDSAKIKSIENKLRGTWASSIEHPIHIYLNVSPSITGYKAKIEAYVTSTMPHGEEIGGGASWTMTVDIRSTPGQGGDRSKKHTSSQHPTWLGRIQQFPSSAADSSRSGNLTFSEITRDISKTYGVSIVGDSYTLHNSVVFASIPPTRMRLSTALRRYIEPVMSWNASGHFIHLRCYDYGVARSAEVPASFAALLSSRYHRSAPIRLMDYEALASQICELQTDYLLAWAIELNIPESDIRQLRDNLYTFKFLKSLSSDHHRSIFSRRGLAIDELARNERMAWDHLIRDQNRLRLWLSSRSAPLSLIGNSMIHGQRLYLRTNNSSKTQIGFQETVGNPRVAVYTLTLGGTSHTELSQFTLTDPDPHSDEL